MSKQNKPVTDAELNAYLDGELKQTDYLRIEAFLAEHPEVAKQLGNDRVIKAGLHQLFDKVLCEDVPEHLYKNVNLKGNYTSRHIILKAAMIAGIMLISGLAGWMLNINRQASSVPVFAHLVQPATFAHIIYSTDALHPVEFNAKDQNILTSWLSTRMHTDITAPILTSAGFELIGGRLLPSSNRMAAQFMYENTAMQRITVYIRRYTWAEEITSFSYAEENGVGVYFWHNQKMGYAVTGKINKNQLMVAAQAVHDFFSNKSDRPL